MWKRWPEGKGAKTKGKQAWWAAEYSVRYEKKRGGGDGDDDDSGGAIRMYWGNVHEPAAVLVALNEFRASGATVSECGMFPSEALLDFETEGGNTTTTTTTSTTTTTTTTGAESSHTGPDPDIRAEQLSLIRQCHDAGCFFGATPDGLITHTDGASVS